MRRADRPPAEALLAEHPDLVGRSDRDQRRLIAHRAHANDTAAVTLMLDLGFDPHAPGVDEAEAIRWAVFQGNAELTRRLLATQSADWCPRPPLQRHLLGWCIYGALHGWRRQSGDFATTARLLLNAGEQVDPSALPTGRADLDAALRGHGSTRRESSRGSRGSDRSRTDADKHGSMRSTTTWATSIRHVRAIGHGRAHGFLRSFRIFRLRPVLRPDCRSRS